MHFLNVVNLIKSNSYILQYFTFTYDWLFPSSISSSMYVIKLLLLFFKQIHIVYKIIKEKITVLKMKNNN